MRHPIILEKHIKGFLTINSEDVKLDQKGEIQEASSFFFIKDCNPKDYFGSWILALLFSLFLLTFIIFTKINPKVFFLFLSSIFATLFLAYYHFLGPDKKLILNRLNGTITFPRPYFIKPKTIRFNQLNAFFMRYGIPDGDDGLGTVGIKLYFEGKYNHFKYTLLNIDTNIIVTSSSSVRGEDYVINYWSFIVWYMDKNRPLPPGTAFDDYRDKDFRRRKEDGFYPPLYKSSIKTAENTLNQQKEYEINT